MALIIV